MNRVLNILFLVLIIPSCRNRQDVQGYWRLNFDEQVEGPFFPMELAFLHDTLLIVDGNNFKQLSAFRVSDDSIHITFKDGFEGRYSFSIESDSAIRLAGRGFSRSSEDYFSKVRSYQLTGWKSSTQILPKINSSIIHLVEEGDLTKVILNDVTSEFKEMSQFLDMGHGERQFLYLYVGEGIEFSDLIESYCWIY